MTQDLGYYVLAYYFFTPIDDPRAEVTKHQEFIVSCDIKCRVYISEEGINGQLSASFSCAEKYMQWLKSDSRFSQINFNIHSYREHVFPRQTVKYRKQIVALDAPVDPTLTGEKVSPSRWSEMLEQRDDKTLLIDVRNDYEWEVGHFPGAELPTLETFRQFPTYARQLKEEHDPKKTKVMMYCTGGIRCELYSALLKQEGFENVFQLEGGVINYGLKEGQKHWKGKLFVFDDRLAVPISDEEVEPISQCHHCTAFSDAYYNCANMDCNELFLCCPDCAENMLGCCCDACQNAPRLRPYESGKQAERPKPFRRSHHYPSSHDQH
jgi:UPF0176 protein